MGIFHQTQYLINLQCICGQNIYRNTFWYMIDWLEIEFYEQYPCHKDPDTCMFLQKSDGPLEKLPSSALSHLNLWSLRAHQFSAKVSKNNSDGRRLEIPNWLCKVNTCNIKRDSYYQAYNTQLSWSSKLSCDDYMKLF